MSGETGEAHSAEDAERQAIEDWRVVRPERPFDPLLTLRLGPQRGEVMVDNEGGRAAGGGAGVDPAASAVEQAHAEGHGSTKRK